MDKQTYIESILKTVKQEAEAWFDEEQSIDDPFDYEQRLFERTLKIGKKMMEVSGGNLVWDRKAKKSPDHFRSYHT